MTSREYHAQQDVVRGTLTNVMGENKRDALRGDFDGRIRLESHGAKVTSDAGLLAYRELDDALGLTAGVDKIGMADPRTGQNTQHTVIPMLRQSIYSRLAGYDDTDDAERLCVDSAMRHIVGARATEKAAASTSQVGRFETQVLTEPRNLSQLMDLPGRWIDQVRGRVRMSEVILDMDSSVSPTHGEQEGTTYNGHFECRCYHPLFCFNQFGDMERALLREGHRRLLQRVGASCREIPGYEETVLPGRCGLRETGHLRIPGRRGLPVRHPSPCQRRVVRADRLPADPSGRSPKEPIISYTDFTYQASTWDKPRRVVAKVEWHRGELYPRAGFIVTNLRRWAGEVVDFDNQRGTAEQWIKEGKYALKWTRLSCCRFVANQVRLQLFALAYNLGNFLRPLVLPPGAKIVRHARYVTFQMAEVAIPRPLFRELRRRIHRLKLKRPLPVPE